MRYRIAHIGLGSALRIAGLVGVAVWLVPGMIVSGAIVAAALRLQATFERLAAVSIAIPDQQIGPFTLQLPPLQIDLVERLGLAQTGQAVAGMSANPALLFVVLTLGCVVLGTVLWLLVAAVAVLIYNVVAPSLGGVEVRLVPEEHNVRAFGASKQ